MKQIALKLEKSDIALIAYDVFPDDEKTDHSVFCFREDICGLGKILLRNILPLFGSSYKIVDECEVNMDDTGEVMTGIITNLPFYEYANIVGIPMVQAPHLSADGKSYFTIVGPDGKKYEYDAGKLVAEACIPNPDPDRYKYVRHKDGNVMNNQASNLEWSETEE